MHNDESLSRYDPVAAWYDIFVRDVANAGNFVLSALFELAGDLRGRKVCDYFTEGAWRGISGPDLKGV